MFRKIPLPFVVTMTLIIGLVMFYFGIRFKGYRPYNNIRYSVSPRGLFFQNNSIAYTDDFFPTAKKSGPISAGLAVEMVLQCEGVQNPAFQYIASVSNGNDHEQLLIGQWRQWLIVMNGDDHDGKEKIARIEVELDTAAEAPVLVSITSGKDGTAIYQDGRLLKSRKDLHLHYPTGTAPSRLILGCNIYGKLAWHGTISEISFYNEALSAQQVQAGYQRRVAGKGKDFNQGTVPEISYVFDRAPLNRRVANLSEGDFPLHVPYYMKYLKKSFLGWPRLSGGIGWNFFLDMIINLFGFTPIGFMLCLTISRFRWPGGQFSIFWVAVGIAFLFSLSLEIAQAWIPTRDSSLMDLLLNTLGAVFGAGVCVSFVRKGDIGHKGAPDARD